MKLKNIKANFLGDSITFGHALGFEEDAFHQVLEKETGMAIARNYGISRTRISKQTNEDDGGSNFVERARSMDPCADLIVVFGGTNDQQHGDSDFGDENSTDIHTFCGAVNILINELKEKYPKATIVFMTPIHRENENEYISSCGKYLKDYANMIKTICNNKNIPCLDLYNECQIDPRIEEQKIKLCPDGIHPNKYGHMLIKNCLLQFLQNL